MSKNEYHCVECGDRIQGDSLLCVTCYRKFHKPCPQCMQQDAKGNWRPRTKGRQREPVDCGYCKNERWIIAH